MKILDFHEPINLQLKMPIILPLSRHFLLNCFVRFVNFFSLSLQLAEPVSKLQQIKMSITARPNLVIANKDELHQGEVCEG